MCPQHMHNFCALSGIRQTLPGRGVNASESRRNPGIEQSCTVAPSVPFFDVKSPFSFRVTLVQGLMVVYEELSSRAQTLYRTFKFFPSYSLKLFPVSLL